MQGGGFVSDQQEIRQVVFGFHSEAFKMIVPHEGGLAGGKILGFDYSNIPNLPADYVARLRQHAEKVERELVVAKWKARARGFALGAFIGSIPFAAFWISYYIFSRP